MNHEMSWGQVNVRSRVKEALTELKKELKKSSFSDVIEYLIDFYRKGG